MATDKHIKSRFKRHQKVFLREDPNKYQGIVHEIIRPYEEDHLQELVQVKWDGGDYREYVMYLDDMLLSEAEFKALKEPVKP